MKPQRPNKPDINETAFRIVQHATREKPKATEPPKSDEKQEEKPTPKTA